MASATYFRLKRQRAKERSQKGVAARERQRISEAVAAVEVGQIIFTGPMFGGTTHRIRCLHRDGDSVLLLEIDGRPVKPRTYRGVLRMLARRVVKDCLTTR